MRSMTKQQGRRDVYAVAMFTASVNLGAVGLKRAGGLDQGWLWTVVVLAACCDQSSPRRSGVHSVRSWL